MRIGIQTWGSHGDIRPFLALAKGLHNSGHQVSLVLTSIYDVDYRNSISEEGIHFESIASPVIRKNNFNYEKFLKFEKIKNPAKQFKNIISELYLTVEKETYEASEKLCKENDIVIGHYIHYPLQTAAEKSGTPHVSVFLMHGTLPTTNALPFGLPKLSIWGNRFFCWLMGVMLIKNVKPYADRLRTQQGLKAAKNFFCISNKLNLIAVSPEICKHQNDWSENIQVCGFLNMPNIIAEGQISEKLELFLKDGDPPVYMNFGTIVPPIPKIQKETIQLFSEASKLANCRSIIQMPLWKQCQVASSKDIHYVSSAPHHLIFPHCKAVVHHGGAGTTQTTMLAGIPSIVVPHISEQNFWGSELKRLGISPSLILRRKVTSEKLARNIQIVENSPTMQAKAKRIGEIMKLENGVSRAVELINQKFKVK
ncbi:MAG: glycosyltransferase family 1 protein [Planctomycetes bacterium]|nr:glycosyltransferase family 1 protein [Planctomycetota bacterium]